MRSKVTVFLMLAIPSLLWRGMALFFFPNLLGETVGPDGPVAGVRVQWRGESRAVFSDALGRFTLKHRKGRLVALREGFRHASVDQPAGGVRIDLRPVSADPHPDFQCTSPYPSATDQRACGNCHGETHREWSRSAHSHSAFNPKFLSLFGDTKHRTWSVVHEHPEGMGVCASCHAPTLSSPTLEYDVRVAEGPAKAGVHCDFCHKAATAKPDPRGLRFGRDAFDLVRPAPGDPVVFGPVADAFGSRESFGFASHFKKSDACAGCHEGVIFGVHVYGTYSEWLKSSAKQRGATCQSCHMAPAGRRRTIAESPDAIEREPGSISDHATPGATFAMLQNSLQWSVKTERAGEAVSVTVNIEATNIGHSAPTGSPERNLILLVRGRIANGDDADLLTGRRLPPAVGDWAGLPGIVFAKMLVGEDGRSPSPFWRTIRDVVDTRLKPEEPRTYRFTFSASVREIQVRLIYRRFWQELAESRGWSDNEIVVRETRMPVP